MASVYVRDLRLSDQVIRKVDGVGLQLNSDSINLGAVRYNASQLLTAAQKATARENIGVGSGIAGSYLGEFENYSSVPETEEGFKSAPQTGDTITVVDASDYYSETKKETLTIQYITDTTTSKQHIVSHLYVGRRVAQRIETSSGPILEKTVLTLANVNAIGKDHIATITFYVDFSGKWLLYYEADEGSSYAKSNWLWQFRVNSDTLIESQLATINEIVTNDIVDLAAETARAKAAEGSNLLAIQSLSNTVAGIKGVPDLSDIEQLTSSDGIAVVRERFNQLLTTLQG